MGNLGFAQAFPTPLFSDNESAIQLVHNPELHRRTKYIDIVYNFISSDHQQRNDMNVCYVPTSDQLAHIFTKPLHTDRFCYLHSGNDLLPCPDTWHVFFNVSSVFSPYFHWTLCNLRERVEDMKTWSSSLTEMERHAGEKIQWCEKHPQRKHQDLLVC